jgi:hypothetical protein
VKIAVKLQHDAEREFLTTIYATIFTTDAHIVIAS